MPSPDGTSTRLRGDNTTPHHHAEHDRTHRAVETLLACDHGLFGLVAD